MNYNLLRLSVLGLAMLGLAALSPAPALAQRTSFYCDSAKSPPTTYIKSRSRRSAVVRWNLGASRASSLERCRIVSQRFQRQYDSGNLRFFKSGYLNGYPVVCAARTSGDRCSNRMLLFTLTKGSDPDRILAKLFNINSLATSAVINQSSNVEGEQTYNFANYISDLPNEADPSGEPTLDR